MTPPDAGSTAALDLAIATTGLTKAFGRHTAVDSLDLTVPRASVFGFLGPNGSGKTTTIRMLLGLVTPTGGRAEVLGASVPDRLPRVLPRVGTLVEGPAFYPFLSGTANLRRLDTAALHASDLLPRLESVVDTIEKTTGELRATFPASLFFQREPERRVGPAPMSGPIEMPQPGTGVRWPDELDGTGWDADELRAVLDLLPAAVAVWDVTHTNLYANRAAVHWFGRADGAELRGLRGTNLVGADVVEVSPPYDHAELTGVAAAHVVYDLISLLALGADAAPGGPAYGQAGTTSGN